MSERRFVIDVVENYHSMAPINIVTESELKRRIEQGFDFIEDGEDDFTPTQLTDIGFRGFLKILLHGEGEKDDDFPGPEDIIKMRRGEKWGGAGEFSGKHCPKCGSQLISNGENVWCSLVPSRGNDGKMQSGCDYGIKEPVTVEQYEKSEMQPSPTPSRQEWECWCNDFALLLYPWVDWERANKIKAHLLSMPGVPKEER